MKNWAMTLVALAGSAVTIYLPQIQHGIAAHPQVATVIAAIYAILAHISPSPMGTSINDKTEGGN